MTKINDGGPAFPLQPASLPDSHYLGMSLRDWFAGQALACMKPPAFYIGRADTEESLHQHAQQAYQVADAMLAARKGKA